MMKLLIFSFSLFCVSCYAQDTKYSDPYQKAEIVGGYDSLTNSLRKLPLIEACSKGNSKSFIRAFLDGKGELKKIEFINAKCKEADSLALEIVKTLKFKPAMKNGKPFESTLIIPMRIGIEDD